jgi:hypothetical protein
MATITYNVARKSAKMDATLGLLSVETVGVAAADGTPLEAGTVCLHRQDDGARVDEWPVAGGSCETDTRAAGTVAYFSLLPVGVCRDFTFEVKDADGNLLGAGCLKIINSCGEGEGADGHPPSGGPLTAPAAVAVEAGCPLRLSGGMVHPCAAADHNRFIGIALNAAAAGDPVRVARWGAARVAGWGLTPGAAYWLPHSGQALAQTPPAAGIALHVGVAQDADTLVLAGGRLAVQPGSALLGYAVWDPAAARIAIVSAAVAGGAGNGGRVIATRADGTLDPSLIPADAALGSLREAFRQVAAVNIDAATLDALSLKLNQVIQILKG